MPRKPRKPIEWTTEEAERKLFPPKVLEEVHRIVREQGDGEEKRSLQSDDNKDYSPCQVYNPRSISCRRCSLSTATLLHPGLICF